jgi:DNA-directed RNA polymerase specialized sigma24 family protein
MLPAQQRRREMLDLADVQAAGTDDLFRQVQNCRDYELLLRSIRQMDAPYREVLMLVYVQEQSVKAAADLLGRPQQTVYTQLKRGRKLLIDLCGKEGLCYVEDRVDAI